MERPSGQVCFSPPPAAPTPPHTGFGNDFVMTTMVVVVMMARERRRGGGRVQGERGPCGQWCCCARDERSKVEEELLSGRASAIGVSYRCDDWKNVHRRGDRDRVSSVAIVFPFRLAKGASHNAKCEILSVRLPANERASGQIWRDAACLRFAPISRDLNLIKFKERSCRALPTAGERKPSRIVSSVTGG